MQKVPLSALVPGAWGILESCQLPPEKARRLEDLGFGPGTAVRCVYRAPAGSPMAFFIKGSLIALRERDCRRITVGRT